MKPSVRGLEPLCNRTPLFHGVGIGYPHLGRMFLAALVLSVKAIQLDLIEVSR